MNNGFTTIAVLGLLLLADAICLKQTLDLYNDLGGSSADVLLIVEALVAAIIIGSVLFLMNRRVSKRPKRLAAFAQVRRLLADVWS